jgi:nucleotide-binding universal stress UspA family protein
MAIIETLKRITLNNLLYLTDFSEASEAAAPFASAIARKYGSNMFVLHVVQPDPYVCMAPECTDMVNEGLEQAAKVKMQRIGSSLKTVPCKTMVEKGREVWPIAKEEIMRRNIDLVCLGTHGRSGVQKFLLSVAEEVFRCSTVPVLTVGPGVKNNNHEGRLSCVLFATDFRYGSPAGLGYAISIARENQARLVLLHVIRQFRSEEMLGGLSGAEAMRQLKGMLPQDAGLSSPVELIVKYGEPAMSIIEGVQECSADLIVLGVHKVERLGVTTHLERTTAHDVVSYAPCPVLTVRGGSDP